MLPAPVPLIREKQQPGSLPQPADYQTTAFADLRRIAAAVALHARASVEYLELLHRTSFGDPTPALIQAALSASDAHLSLAVVAWLCRLAGADISLTEAAAALSRLSEKARQLHAGLNPVGLPDNHIAYTYNPALGAHSNNFAAQLEQFDKTWLPGARGAAATAQESRRSFERDLHALRNELQGQATHYGERLASLCGGAAAQQQYAQCGAQSGEVYLAKLEVTAAVERMKLAALDIKQAYEAIRIEENRAAEIAKVHRAQAFLVLSNNARVAALNDEAAMIKASESLLGGYLGFVGALTSPVPNPGAAFGAIAGGFANAAASVSLAEIENQKRTIAARESAQVEFNVVSDTLTNSAAVIKNHLLEIPSLFINQHLAALDASRATARLKSLYQAAIDAEAARQRALAASGSDPRSDPGFRIHRNKESEYARLAFEHALREAFLLTRSFEYELNFSYAARGALFTRSNVAELEQYVNELRVMYDGHVGVFGHPQARSSVLSLRDDVLRLAAASTDQATGKDYTPEELFRRFVADPHNRDGQGNLRLRFNLSLAPDAAIFNHALCSDRLKSIRVSLVASSLGAMHPEVELKQLGSAYLRSCAERDPDGRYLVREYALEDTLGQRRALITAGVNLAGPMDPNQPPPNTELYGRPIAATYELTLRPAAPANHGIDLTALEDIVLYLDHESRTTQ